METIISQQTEAAVISVLKDTEKTSRKWMAVADTCKADGITWESLKPKGAHRDAMKEVVVKAFSKADQELLDKPTITLSDVDKMLKRELLQKVGRYVALIQKHLKPKVPRGAVHRATLAERLEREWTAQVDAIKKAQKSENGVDFDADIVIKTLKELIADI